jgi:hypothetical protein
MVSAMATTVATTIVMTTGIVASEHVVHLCIVFNRLT